MLLQINWMESPVGMLVLQDVQVEVKCLQHEPRRRMEGIYQVFVLMEYRRHLLVVNQMTPGFAAKDL